MSDGFRRAKRERLDRPSSASPASSGQRAACDGHPSSMRMSSEPIAALWPPIEVPDLLDKFNDLFAGTIGPLDTSVKRNLTDNADWQGRRSSFWIAACSRAQSGRTDETAED